MLSNTQTHAHTPTQIHTHTCFTQLRLKLPDLFKHTHHTHTTHTHTLTHTFMHPEWRQAFAMEGTRPSMLTLEAATNWPKSRPEGEPCNVWPAGMEMYARRFEVCFGKARILVWHFGFGTVPKVLAKFISQGIWRSMAGGLRVYTSLAKRCIPTWRLVQR